MSEEKFTPGEWEIEEKEMSCGSMFRYGFQVVCWGKHRRIAYMETGSLGDKEEMQANAHLIAAAPDMYRVLSGICFEKSARCCNYAPESCEVCSIRKALKKARGEE